MSSCTSILHDAGATARGGTAVIASTADPVPPARDTTAGSSCCSKASKTTAFGTLLVLAATMAIVFATVCVTQAISLGKKSSVASAPQLTPDIDVPAGSAMACFHDPYCADLVAQLAETDSRYRDSGSAEVTACFQSADCLATLRATTAGSPTAQDACLANPLCTALVGRFGMVFVHAIDGEWDGSSGH